MEDNKCLLCNQPVTYVLESGRAIHKCVCINCGEYRISDKLKRTGIKEGLKYLLSGYIREMNELGKTDLLLLADKNHNYRDYLDSPIVPHTIDGRINKLLLFLYRKTERLHQAIPVRHDVDTAICYAFDTDELHEIIKLLMDSEYINSPKVLSETSLSLTLKGIQYAEKLEGIRAEGQKVFVAAEYMAGNPRKFAQNVVGILKG